MEIFLKVIFGILVVPITVLLSLFVVLALAWVPMLGWNIGVLAVFPELPTIDYMQAFWISCFVTFVRLPVKA